MDGVCLAAGLGIVNDEAFGDKVVLLEFRGRRESFADITGDAGS